MNTKIADLIIYTVFIIMAAAIASTAADAVFGPENVSYWLANLIS